MPTTASPRPTCPAQITFDRTTHVPALSTDAVSPTNAASATVTVDFGEPIDPATFTISDVSVYRRGRPPSLAQDGCNDPAIHLHGHPSASDGTITVTIPAGSVTDPAGNSITASNALQITFDRTTHVPALSTDAVSPTNAASATVTVDFGEPIDPATFTISDVSVYRRDGLQTLPRMGATTQRYTFTVTSCLRWHHHGHDPRRQRHGPLPTTATPRPMPCR